MLNNVFYKDNTWNFVSKEVNHKNLQINYVTHSGYSNQKEAEAACRIAEKNFKSEMDKVRNITGVKYTFKSYLDFWFQFILQQYAGGSRQSVCSWAIYNIIFPVIEKDILLVSINADYINNILRKTKDYSKHAPSTAKKVILLALKHASNDGLIRPIDPALIDHYPIPKKKLVIYSKKQIASLLSAGSQCEYIYLEMLLALFCGLRTGEILGLKYNDFDLEKNTVTVNRQYTRDFTLKVVNGESTRILSNHSSIKPPKSISSYRTLRVPAMVMEQVQLRKKWNMKYLRSKKYTLKWKDFICIGQYGHIKSTSTFREALVRICKQNNLTRLSPHDLRHLYAGILIEQNVPLDRISKLMGHRHTRTTFEIYCSIIYADEQVKEYVEQHLDPVSGIYLENA